jgi:hypothetical protein
MTSIDKERYQRPPSMAEADDLLRARRQAEIAENLKRLIGLLASLFYTHEEP